MRFVTPVTCSGDNGGLFHPMCHFSQYCYTGCQHNFVVYGVLLRTIHGKHAMHGQHDLGHDTDVPQLGHHMSPAVYTDIAPRQIQYCSYLQRHAWDSIACSALWYCGQSSRRLTIWWLSYLWCKSRTGLAEPYRRDVAWLRYYDGRMSPHCRQWKRPMKCGTQSWRKCKLVQL